LFLVFRYSGRSNSMSLSDMKFSIGIGIAAHGPHLTDAGM
jgi:hypothetical protein